MEICLPNDLETLLKSGNKELKINAVKLRKYDSEAEIKDIEAIKEGAIIYLTTKEDEKLFQ